MATQPTPRPAASDPSAHDHREQVGGAPAPAVEVVRSEERLRVGHQVRVTGRAVLRKYVVTETVTQTFQVRHEEVRLEHEPATGDDAGSGRTPLVDGVAVEMVLHREVPRVVMDVVPTELVRLHVDTVTEQRTVSESVRKEQVTVDPPEARSDR